MPEYTADADGVGVLRMLNAIRAAGMEKDVRFYQASTSELYGKVQEVPQSETTPFYPRSPYAGKIYGWLARSLSPVCFVGASFFGVFIAVLGEALSPCRPCPHHLLTFLVWLYSVHCGPVTSLVMMVFGVDGVMRVVAKQYAYWILVNYREAYGMHLTNGILFNHESPRRGRTFVTRKITAGVAKIVTGQQKTLYLGNLDAKRDWGHARDYVEGMWMMLQQEESDDYVLATGETHSVREFVEKAFKHAGLPIKWTGPAGTVDEIGVEDGNEDRVLVKIDPQYFRPTEVDLLLGDPTKAKTRLGWVAKTPFDSLVKEMVEADIAMVKGETADCDKMISD